MNNQIIDQLGGSLFLKMTKIKELEINEINKVGFKIKSKKCEWMTISCNTSQTLYRLELGFIRNENYGAVKKGNRHTIETYTEVQPSHLATLFEGCTGIEIY